MAITVSRRERATPLVVSVLPAQRRFAFEVSSAITTQSSDFDSDSARSTTLRPPAVYPSQLAHQEASSAVLSIRMPRISTEGAP